MIYRIFARRCEDPATCELREIDQFVDPSDIRLSDVGSTSIDAELIIRMPLVGYCYGIRPERRLTRLSR